VRDCSCRPAEAPRQTTRDMVSTAQEAGGAKPATSPQSTASPERGPWEAAHTAGGAQRPPIGANARTGSATVCEPSLRTHRPQPKPTLTREHPRRGGVGGGGCPAEARHTLPLDLTAQYKAGVGRCPRVAKGTWRCAWTHGVTTHRADSSGAVPTQSHVAYGAPFEGESSHSRN
jgi:hypothetical protein